MVVCQCERVSDRRVTKAIKAGCASVAQLAEATGAGRTCGACHRDLEEMLMGVRAGQGSTTA